MPEPGSMNMSSQFSTPKKMIQQFILIHQPTKRETHQEPHISVPDKTFFKRNNYVT